VIANSHPEKEEKKIKRKIDWKKEIDGERDRREIYIFTNWILKMSLNVLKLSSEQFLAKLAYEVNFISSQNYFTNTHFCIYYYRYNFLLSVWNYRIALLSLNRFSSLRIICLKKWTKRMPAYSNTTHKSTKKYNLKSK